MESPSLKTIRKTAKQALEPLGFIRYSDQHWLHDGGWWLTHIYFPCRSRSRDVDGQVFLSLLLDGHDHNLGSLSDQGIRAYHMDGEEAFDREFRQMLDRLIAKAIAHVNRIRTPQDMLDYLAEKKILKYPHFHSGVLHELSGDRTAAKKVFRAILSEEITRDWQVDEQRKAAFAMKLIDKQELFRGFIDVLIRRARQDRFPGTWRRELPAYPWE